MITEQDLQEAIKECEGQRNPTSNTCVKLAAFYTIRDKMFPARKAEEQEEKPVFYSRSSEPIEYESDTEFGRVISNVPKDQLFSVMDELMSTLQVLNPRLYAGVIRKLENKESL